MKKAVGLFGATVAGVISIAAPAFAHVTIDPGSAPKGGEVVLTFRVPNEEDNATTTKLQLSFPSDHPVLGVDPEPTHGWQDSVITTPLNPPVTTDDGRINNYVSEIDWTGGSIPAGHFQEFKVLAQSLPTDTDQIIFKAIQTYSNGDVVRWIDQTVAGQPGPDHPAPVLNLTAAQNDSSSSAADAVSMAISTTGLAKKSSVNAALVVGIVGLAIAVLSLIGVVISLARKKA